MIPSNKTSYNFPGLFKLIEKNGDRKDQICTNKLKGGGGAAFKADLNCK